MAKNHYTVWMSITGTANAYVVAESLEEAKKEAEKMLNDARNAGWQPSTFEIDLQSKITEVLDDEGDSILPH